ncbi:hypothetical protein B0H14DRAFT_2568191 [Mycena olivaceomarginata]|nr:hypothetical protein B0H14DRAFT_2568191 [Mycena olivaceomarginata]
MTKQSLSSSYFSETEYLFYIPNLPGNKVSEQGVQYSSRKKNTKRPLSGGRRGWIGHVVLPLQHHSKFTIASRVPPHPTMLDSHDWTSLNTTGQRDGHHCCSINFILAAAASPRWNPTTLESL